ncbi:MAG: lipoate--protein ligase family protein [Calditrichaeota bacterium]|nr:MAG: lipoate--protein ligase family protein [Calditrichota bacterium]MBL1207094.1 lipoate--protein ligase family protein [Calditrichota bacterium]NOG46924.1 lipoate--protein ligase family protein [Calditrichota bacterium]
MHWRLICDENVSASFGLAADEVLTKHIGQGKSIPVLRLYSYKNYSALVGRFQEVESELNVDFCRKKEIAINRRPTGGGAIFMGEDQLGIAMCIPGKSDDNYGRARELMGHFSEGIINGLNSIGVPAQFRRKNDIEVNGKKIAGLGIYRDNSGGLLFHSSLLVDMDIEMMLNVLNTPFEKISDKEVDTVSKRITTVFKETNSHINMAEMRKCIAGGFKSSLNISLSESSFAETEKREIAILEKEKYAQQDWIYQTPQVKDAIGTAKLKTEKGLLDIRLTLAGQQIKALFIRGDFFAGENAVADLEGSFRWHSTNQQKIELTLDKVYKLRKNELASLPLGALKKAITLALNRARVLEKKQSSEPYGCFVTPGGRVHV